ncbi:rRNA biogenesis protein rrp5 [Knufia peltigerae]|uniref:rRNA biogenesis protein rrp5 n=1 Tax=Knufia peltigerae TaxID=1002370 RepID=A0AA38YD80_9EURO|nr:rRNA biogenesis protein rrp5 [Knufia peltigerae]
MAPSKRKLAGDEVPTSPANKRSKSETKFEVKTKKQTPVADQDTTQKPKHVSVLTKEQPAFPRGGAGLLTPLEQKQIQVKATRDVARERKSQDLFGGASTQMDTSDEEQNSLSGVEVKKPAKKSKKSKRRPESSTTDAPEVQIGGLNYKRITTDSLILGQIISISTRTLTLALPNNLVGYVPLTSISPQFSEKIQALIKGDADQSDEDEDNDDEERDIALKNYFRVGQYLRAAVTSTEQEKGAGRPSARKRIELSIEPALTNIGLNRTNLATGATVQVSVRSVEDTGLAVELAFNDNGEAVRGFVSKKELPDDLPLSDVRTGTVLLCTILEGGSKGKVLRLSADLSKSLTVKSAPSIDTFLPGTRAEILITQRPEYGLAGKIMGMLDVTADLVHSGSYKDKEAFLAKFEVGKKVTGRLICNFPTSDVKKLGFSVLDDLVDLKPDEEQSTEANLKLALSSVIDEATVVRVESGLGVYLQLNENLIGFAHISRLSDEKTDTLSEASGPFKLGTNHKARVLDYNPIDNLYVLSLQQKVLNQPFLRFDDVPIGAVVKGTVEKIIIGSNGVSGLLVNLAEGISGLVPQIHMSDVDLKHPERKFRVGQTVTARVLSTDPARRRLKLTLKKSIVNSDQKAWLRFDDIEVGSSTVGTLTKVDRFGAVVRFFGPVRGFLPVHEMSEAYIKDATEHFRVGQVLTVNAISINAEDRRLTVSCRDANANPSTESALAALKHGSLVSGTVFEKSQNDILLRLEGSDAIARLTLDHVSDGTPNKRASAFNKIRVGQKLENLVILQVQAKRRLVVLTNKQSLVKAAQDGTLLKSYEELQLNALVTGYVSNITEDGVFVTFAANISGLITRKQVPVEQEDQHDFDMTKFQPVTARILSIDYKGATPRFWLTMRDGISEPTTEDPALPLPDVVEPIDTSLKTLDDLSVGKLTKVRITSVKETQINVELAKNVQGRIDVSEVFDEWKNIKDRKRPLKHFSPKQELNVKILGAHDTRNHRFLPLTHRQGKNTVLELSCKPSSVSEPGKANLKLQDVSVGSSWLAFVNNITEDCLWVNISPSVRGRIRVTDVSDDLSLTSNVEANFPVGSALRVHVVSVDAEKNRLDLTARSDASVGSLTIKDISKGLILPGRVTKVGDRNVLVQLSEHVVGAVELIDIADNYNDANTAKFQKNDVLRVCVLDVDVPNKKVRLSTRRSKVLSSSSPVNDPDITSIDHLSVNDVVRGFICNITDKGVFVTLGHGFTAFVRVSHLSDQYLKDWKDHFQRDQLVQGKITLVDKVSGHIQMSLKQSALDPNYKAPLTFGDLHVGDIVTAKVVKVESFGVFIVVDNSENVRGLCHRSEIAEQRIEDATKLFSEGDAVKAKVLKLDPANRRVNFGMKASYFADVAGVDAPSGDEDDEEDGVKLDEVMDDVDNDDEDVEASEDDDDELQIDLEGSEDDEDAEADDSELEASDDETKAAGSKLKGLSVGGFDWTGTSGLVAGKAGKRVAEDSESDNEQASKSHKKKKKRAETVVDRTADLDTNGPQSSDDFERLLLAEPDSGDLWLQYMAFHLGLEEVDRAREIGERALRSIGLGPGSEEEKLKVWTALLNLEDARGDDESLDAIFKRALEYNDQQQIYSRVASILIQSGKYDRASEKFNEMLKKFKADLDVWVNYATFLFDVLNKPDEARDLLPRASKTLPSTTKDKKEENRARFELTKSFALLEFKSKHGLPERGRTLFEGLLAEYPKRLDLFNVILDQEEKLGDQEKVRETYERVLGVKLKPEQAKHFFKRWVKFEEKRGGGSRKVEEVQARAAEWAREYTARQQQQVSE